MATKNTSSREAKAQELLNGGAISLYVGKGYALVQGSGGRVYQVGSTGCTCPDATSRQVTCKHELAVRQLCAEYRQLKAAAQRGERVRPSTALLQAIRWPEPANHCRDCGKATKHDLCADCWLGHQPETPGSAFPLNLPEVA